MKLKSSSVLAILLSVFLGFSSLSRAEQVTKNSYEDSFPQIKGNYLVWQGLVDGNWEIFLYNINEAEAGPMQITHNNYDDISPQTDGHHVVWVGNSRSGGEIFLYDISTEEIIQITDDDNVDSSAQIANGLIVWTSHEVTASVEPGEIFLYNAAHKTTSLLSASVDPDGTLDDSSPRINSESVIWVQADEAGNTTIFIHELAAGITTEAPEGFVWEESRQTDGDLAVFSRKVDSDWEIFIRNTNLQNYEQITDNDLEDTYPGMSGNAIAWVRGQGVDSEIFLASYSAEPIALLSPQDGAVLPQKPRATFCWESAVYDKAKVQFSQDSSFPKKETLNLPFSRRWLSESCFTPRGIQWWFIRLIERRNGYIYWRVKGKDTNGNVSFSQAHSFSVGKSRYNFPKIKPSHKWKR